MNKLFRWITFSTILLLSLTTRGVSEESPVPVVPAVFFLSRAANPYCASKEEMPTMVNIKLIIDAARKILKLDPYPSEYFENIIILDEGDSWLVSFHAKGNGNVRFPSLNGSRVTTDATGYFLVNANAGVYLDKVNLTIGRISHVSPICSLPSISPMGEKIQGLGFVVVEQAAQPLGEPLKPTKYEPTRQP